MQANAYSTHHQQNEDCHKNSLLHQWQEYNNNLQKQYTYQHKQQFQQQLGQYNPMQRVRQQQHIHIQPHIYLSVKGEKSNTT